ncbi:hypothetical protein [Geobacter sp. DSM 9736]|uniref:hypothetical protein n=1 Tax=Geobacter sp. DSM 9736 TaxID=1277350 RepID=UPI000B511D14|nr:hypothetical protein [Geobacter sp. DSM 9736]
MISVFLAISIILCTAGACSAVELTVVPSGERTFAVTGTGIDRLAAVDVYLTYDPKYLAGPRVVKGALAREALLKWSVRGAGSLRIGILNPGSFASSGELASVSFDKVQDVSGGVATMAVSAIDRRGMPVPVRTKISVPPGPAVPTPSSASRPDPDKRVALHSSVLDRFREFKGERTPGNLMFLFQAPAGAGYRQEPPVAISNGIGRVKLFISSREREELAPGFAVRGARLFSIGVREGGWVIEVVPEKGTIEAVLSIMRGGMLYEIPLVVAPLYENGKKKPFEEAELLELLVGRAGVEQASFDLNHDGRHDFIDDYILIANYLSGGGSAAQKAAIF